ncbi:OLC1v1010795C1 [Oldenlandia corymbosa var. corymbosa]|uniref:OLC1v1010795C1 n=1 Tax=Oldenlandia corymbosa var. corymbosa TaxID=529605 RepID=A0AAV1DS76_OLDCO|nr:OLC1v1010795C1 [Oldenlandia corymbosa var. corymbosa]
MADHKILEKEDSPSATCGKEDVHQGSGISGVLDSPQIALKISNELLIDPNHLTIGSMISEGLYSIVHEGCYNSEPVAVKVIKPGKSADIGIKMFEREVMILSRLKHENVVKFIGAAVEPSLLVLTELVKGSNLQKHLWSLRPNRLDLKLSLSLALDISRVMEYLHGNGIIHRDLKPGNILLTEDKSMIKLAEFGLANEGNEDWVTTSEVGTYRWMAPELFNITEHISGGTKKPFTRKVDVYSFSIILWELLTNNTPFKGRNNVMVAYAVASNQRPSLDNIPPEIVPLLKNCWAPDPNDRPEFEQITEFLSALIANTASVEKAPSVP